jgi:hypothetical protein
VRLTPEGVKRRNSREEESRCSGRGGRQSDGDTQLELALDVPGGFEAGKLQIVIVTPGGETEPREITIAADAALVQEKEPNGGFLEAQVIEPGNGSVARSRRRRM